MEIAPRFSEAADRLGMAVSVDDSKLLITRHEMTVRLRDTSPARRGAEPQEMARAPWILFGIRLGIDKLTHPDDDQDKRDSPMRFRRTSLRRYHEAPSVHGDRLPLLVPRLTRTVFEAITSKSAFFRTWLLPELEVLVVCETGIRLELLTAREQRDADESDQQRWRNTRSALFYQSYKVRPRKQIEIDAGVLRIFDTTEGFGATRALLLPEYDYDASREFGFLAVPSRDQIIIARPDDRRRAHDLLPELRHTVGAALEKTAFGLTDAIFQLQPDNIKVFDDGHFHITDDGYSADEIIGDVSSE